MKKAYKVFVDYFESQKPSDGLHTLHEYLDWFEQQFGEITTPSNSSTETIYFTFDSSPEIKVIDNLLKGLIDELVLDFEDDEDELEEYVKVVGTTEKIHRYFGSGDTGVFYSVLDLNSEDSFIKAYIDLSSEFMGIHPVLEENFNQMDSWGEFRSYEEDDDGYAYVDWNELGDYIRDHFMKHVYDDLENILKGFIVIECAGTWYEVCDSLGTSYYVLSGYNPELERVEAYVIKDSCH